MVRRRHSAFKKAGRKSRRRPYRDVFKDGVTYSFLSEFLNCREQARLSFAEGFTSSSVEDSLEFGSIFHTCMERIAKVQQEQAKHLGDEDLTVLAKQSTSEYLRSRTNGKRLKEADRDRLEHLSTLVSQLFPMYWAFWRDSEGARKGVEFRPNAKFVSQEEKFCIPHRLPSGKEVPLRGRLDGLILWHEEYWLMETKTKAMIDEEGLTSSLPQDLQTMLYCHAVSCLYGVSPKGVIYNVIRRPGLRQKQQESSEDFRRRILDDVADRPDHYFMRWHVNLEPNDVIDWVTRSLNPILEEVARWWDGFNGDPLSDPFTNPFHYQNPEGLYNRYGKSRYFEYLTRNSTYGLTRRKPENP